MQEEDRRILAGAGLTVEDVDAVDFDCLVTHGVRVMLCGAGGDKSCKQDGVKDCFHF